MFRLQVMDLIVGLVVGDFGFDVLLPFDDQWRGDSTVERGELARRRSALVIMIIIMSYC